MGMHYFKAQSLRARLDCISEHCIVPPLRQRVSEVFEKISSFNVLFSEPKCYTNNNPAAHRGLATTSSACGPASDSEPCCIECFGLSYCDVLNGYKV